MEFKSINPFNDQVVGSYLEQTASEVDEILNAASQTFTSWRNTSFKERAALMYKAAAVLRDNADEYAKMISLEMGKPILESLTEVNKCAWVCEYYAENAHNFLADEIIETEASLSFVQHHPIGCVLAIMPWNFPFWQVFRFAAPTLMAGNTGILKHSSNVFGCATLIEEVFIKAGFPKGAFQNLIVHHDKIEGIIESDVVKAITLTGSERAGSAVASIAGKNIKRSLLELGGSNAFILWEDADLDAVLQTALTARMLNCGQSCIAAKRFILVGDMYDKFVPRFTEALRNLSDGDPLDVDTKVGPMARRNLADELHIQVNTSIEQGAKLLLGGKQRNCYHEPTVLGEVTPGMAVFDEETFGPVAAMVRANDEEDAFRLSELSRYGLGVTVCTTNTDKALAMSHMVSDGAYFINELVKSDPRLPFGGEKLSGFGRELAKDGMMEFVNRKTVYVK